MSPRVLAPLLLPVLVLGAPRAQDDPTAPREPVTVVLVRHAETEPGHGSDRALSAPGKERAARLARLLGEAGVTHLFTSEYPRTRQTLGPLAERTGLEVREVSARDDARQVAELRDLPPGSIAVVAGHSNTVPALARGLGGEVTGLVDSPYGPTLPEDAFDRLLIVTLPGVPEAAVDTLELRYGAQ